ncbi:hypothetical protein CYY_009269 [Polysphondylium violaceum]|uniref:Uncharacterized protein n=1 Tax=Polysphondylium violaceum TaxID=133409 RepID=A0A8J4PLV1_9MYCE|nr:hypothetical protein CYY_009269 [Polysphondylium violaceum]
MEKSIASRPSLVKKDVYDDSILELSYSQAILRFKLIDSPDKFIRLKAVEQHSIYYAYKLKHLENKSECIKFGAKVYLDPFLQVAKYYGNFRKTVVIPELEKLFSSSTIQIIEDRLARIEEKRNRCMLPMGQKKLDKVTAEDELALSLPIDLLYLYNQFKEKGDSIKQDSVFAQKLKDIEHEMSSNSTLSRKRQMTDPKQRQQQELPQRQQQQDVVQRRENSGHEEMVSDLLFSNDYLVGYIVELLLHDRSESESWKILSLPLVAKRFFHQTKKIVNRDYIVGMGVYGPVSLGSDYCILSQFPQYFNHPRSIPHVPFNQVSGVLQRIKYLCIDCPDKVGLYRSKPSPYTHKLNQRVSKLYNDVSFSNDDPHSFINAPQYAVYLDPLPSLEFLEIRDYICASQDTSSSTLIYRILSDGLVPSPSFFQNMLKQSVSSAIKPINKLKHLEVSVEAIEGKKVQFDIHLFLLAALCHPQSLKTIVVNMYLYPKYKKEGRECDFSLLNNCLKQHLTNKYQMIVNRLTIDKKGTITHSEQHTDQSSYLQN